MGWMALTYMGMLQNWLAEHPPPPPPRGRWGVVVLLPTGNKTGNAQLDRLFQANDLFNRISLEGAAAFSEANIPILWARYDGRTWHIECEHEASPPVAGGDEGYGPV